VHRRDVVTQPAPQFSQDGSGWWDGGQWLPATAAPDWAQARRGELTPGPAQTTLSVSPPGIDAWHLSELAGRVQSAVETELLPGETVLLRGRLHWWPAYWPAAALAGLGMMYVLLLLAISPLSALGLLLFWLVPAALGLLGGKLRRDLTAFELTDHRLLVKQGVLRRRSAELLLRQVESATVTQNVVSGLLDYGDLVVGGTGGHKEVLRGLAHPAPFRAAVQRAVAVSQGRRT
jgi:hypothetical protein